METEIVLSERIARLCWGFMQTEVGLVHFEHLDQQNRKSWRVKIVEMEHEVRNDPLKQFLVVQMVFEHLKKLLLFISVFKFLV